MRGDFTQPQKVINLDAYPLDQRDSPTRRAVIDRCRRELEAQQYCVLPNFILSTARQRAVEDALERQEQAHHISSRRNCYLQRQPDPALPADHPRNIFMEASSRMIAYDHLPDDSPLKTLYHWDETRAFIAEIVGVKELFDNEDPYQPVNTLCFHDGDRSSWHFDSCNAFTVTLMLQAPEGGGDFEIVPNARSDDDQNHAYVASFLQGKRSGDAIRVSREPGALCIFRGCNSLHRVSPVSGNTRRLMGVFVYENEPGVIGDPEVNETVYGARVTAGPAAS
ncbi:HalD/BesD family halogenase [Limibacillus halophilus]|uniref:Fe2OG dioxygenase domain-containing protein n=1 Tax=Limibacillus halophilus TaxID=1579333 RepID=A0A839SNY4_9PROT|nr:2OG-Fe(II) oxygenase [Limibacillus halophilus]MBB3064162.1 hypothetical protein [Limibacillus halophilus]